MMMTREMMKILEEHGYSAVEWVDGEADIFYKGRFVETVRGEWDFTIGCVTRRCYKGASPYNY